MFWNCPRLKPPRMGNFDFESANTRNMFSDRALVCRECGAEFIFTKEERLFYVEKNFQNEPARCPDCREERRKQNTTTQAPGRKMEIHPCSSCGKLSEFPFTPSGKMPIYCSDCWNKLRGN